MMSLLSSIVRVSATAVPAALIPVALLAQTLPDPAARRVAVERTLLPAVLIEGRPFMGWSIQERMERYRVPAVSVAVIRGGVIDWTAAYGVLGVSARQPVTTTTLFQAGSLSKPVAAAVALRLVESGVLSLDHDVNAELRSWRIPQNEYTAGRSVTLRALLSHTAGVTVSSFPGYVQGSQLPSLHQVMDGEAPATTPPIRIDRAPGSGLRYSGGGYQIVQQLTEDLLGKPFAQVADDLVLTPLRMQRSTFASIPPAGFGHDIAAGHRFDGIGVRGGWHLYPEQAAASLWSTPADLARFMIGVMKAYTGSDTRLMNMMLAGEMLTPVSGTMGLGFGVHGTGEALHVDHAGWNQGYRTYVLGYPVTGDGIVVMTNSDAGNELIAEIVRSVARVYRWPDFAPPTRPVAALDSATLNSYAGTFRVESNDLTISVVAVHDHLVVMTPRGSWYAFHPASRSEFFAIEDGGTLQFYGSAEGITALRLWGMTARRTASD
jgi:CubicO group peptidase (beta-lactamase class C family)